MMISGDPFEQPAARARRACRRTVTGCAVATGALLLLSGCVRLEYDKMTGTTFPPQIMQLGVPVTVETIFFDVGRFVFLEPDEAFIPPLNIADDDCMSDAELDALEAGHRSSPLFPVQFEYFLYGATVDHHGEVLDTCIPEWILGKMWAGHTRSAFALFYPNPHIVSGSPEYLRTTAHEIGHALNLHHEDGDGSTTIMTQTGDLNGSWDFTFTLDSTEHLQDHPTACTFPGAVGGAPFTWVTNSHAVSHPGTTPYDC